MNVMHADAYKYTHGDMYPDDLSHMHAYMFARNDSVLFFGLRAILADLVVDANPFTASVTDLDKHMWTGTFAKRFEELRDWQAMHGGLPLLITAVPEGTWVPKGEPMVTVTNTDPRFAWLVTWVETILLKVWYPATIATRQRNLYRDLAKKWSGMTTDMDKLQFAVHDFGYRGATSEQSAQLGGAAHLLTFNGTDTMGGVQLLQSVYDIEHRGLTIPASEHSVMMLGSDEEMISRILDVVPDDVPVSIVLDTYNYMNALHTICTTFKERIMQRQADVILRPDSGDPEMLIPWTLGSMIGAFGTEANAYGLLRPKHVKLIWGDGLTHERILELTDLVIGMGIDPTSVVFGMGGALHNGVTRDTLGFSYKVSQVARNGQIIDVQKHAVGKESRAGRQQVHNGEVVYHDGDFPECSKLVTL